VNGGPAAWLGRSFPECGEPRVRASQIPPKAKEAQLRRTNSGRHFHPVWAWLALALVGAPALAAPLTAGADADAQATVSPGLLAAAQAEPSSAFSVIVHGEAGTEAVVAEVESAAEDQGATGEPATPVDDTFVTVPGVAATLTGDEIVALASSSEPLVITLDTPTTAADAPTNTAPPTIQGSAVAGATLSAEAGAWSGAPLSYSFQWQRCPASGDGCNEIAAATGGAYTLEAADVGSIVRVLVSASGSEGSATALSGPTAVVAAADAPVAAPVSTAAPQVSGLEEPGQVLTATPGVWTGGGDLAHSYQWQRCTTRYRDEVVAGDAPLGFWRLSEIVGEAAADASGHGLDGGYVGAVTYGIGGVTGDSNTGVGLLGTGSVEVPGLSHDAFLTRFSLEAWVDTSGPQQTKRGVVARWLPGEGGIMLWVDEAGNYGLVAGRDEAYLRTEVAPSGLWEHLVGTWDGSMLRLYRNGTLIGSQEFSGPLGEPAVNLTLGGYSSGMLLNADLDEVAVYDRALSDADVQGHYWGCRDLVGATQASYTATAVDLGFRLRASVTTANAAGSSSSTSAVTAPVSARPPTSTSRPTILGTVEEGQTVTAANGGWDGTSPFSFDYEWERCDADGANCSDIWAAGDAVYVVRPYDVGRRIRVRVIADNLGGARSAVSHSSELVPAMPEALPAFKQHWPYVAGVPSLHARPGVATGQPGTIAIVDSGIDASRADFGDRVIEQVTLTQREPNSPGDGYGHGTAVASVAAGNTQGYTGAAPGARIVSLDVLDDNGVGNVSDVIDAADWIYANRERLGIKVANFSLHGTTLASIVSDPLDRAVERLWQSGIVVVAAAGNYASDGAESAVAFAPGNDPFVLTVGATDTRGSYTERDDVAAPWSAWGYTRDGFAKPELVAPGRYIAAAVPPDAKLTRDRPDRVVEPGYLQLSGTSFAAPVVAGSAAAMLAEHPNWTPDQVKGALMLTAKPLPQATTRSVGVGTVSAADAAAVADPPNPNVALNDFLVADPAGGPTRVFDTSRWTQVVQTDPAWASVAWGSVAWGSAAWSSVAWGSVAWGSVAWGSVAWGSVAWGSVAWGSVAWGSTAKDDVRQGGAYWVHEN
jgi:serine protease AprX